MDKSNLAEQIGQAWITYRKGQLDAAAKAFEDLVNRNSDSIDALYGLGLVRRSQGNRGTATELFEKASSLVASARQQDAGSDRLQILQRMILQRLQELGAAR
ncbi:MAG: tetratricopeptide repeat protein [Anaerolineae bacterium]|nr:tetratricopeptide repeat protein [Anaerolineae bacterium]